MIWHKKITSTPVKHKLNREQFLYRRIICTRDSSVNPASVCDGVELQRIARSGAL